MSVWGDSNGSVPLRLRNQLRAPSTPGRPTTRRSSLYLPGKFISSSPANKVNKPWPGVNSISTPSTSSAAPTRFFTRPSSKAYQGLTPQVAPGGTRGPGEIIGRQTRYHPGHRDQGCQQGQHGKSSGPEQQFACIRKRRHHAERLKNLPGVV